MAVDERKNSRGPMRRVGMMLRHGRNWLTVENHQVGNIESDQPVFVAGTAIVTGDIRAPKVVVSGLLYGQVQTDDLTLENGGQIWGDVFTKALRVETGCKIHGWVSTQDEQALSLMQPEDFPVEVRSVLDANSPPIGQDNGKTRIAIWRQLQAEAAAALVSRKAIQHDFDERIEEVAGDSIAEASELRVQLEALQQQQAIADLRLSRLQEMAQIRDEKLQSRAAELTDIQAAVDQRDETIEELQTLAQEQALRLNDLEMTRQTLEAQISTENSRAKELGERTENLETALQDSLQHTSELEESLFRWQELAEVTENQVEELKSEIDLLNLQLNESRQVVEMLQAQREEVEEQWNRTDIQFRESEEARAAVEASLAEASHELDAFRHENQWLRAELSAIKEQVNSWPDDYEEFGARIAVAEQKAQVLDDQLRNVQAEAQTNYEKLLWSQAAHQATASELEEALRTIQERDTVICLMEEKLAERLAEANKWQTSVGRMTDLLYDAEKKLKETEAQLARVGAQDDEGTKALREVARQRQLQLEAYEEEIENLHQQIAKQSQRLAEAQVALVEGEITIDGLRSENETHRQEIERVKRLAVARIQKLEAAQQRTQAELGQAQRKLNDLTVWLERKRNRGEEPLPGETDSLDPKKLT